MSLSHTKNHSIFFSFFFCVLLIAFDFRIMFPAETANFYFLVKVFHFQRKTFLFSFGFFFPILFFSYKFCVRNFSKTTRPIYMKRSVLKDNNMSLIAIFSDDIFRFGDFNNLTISEGQDVQKKTPKKFKIFNIKFQGL